MNEEKDLQIKATRSHEAAGPEVMFHLILWPPKRDDDDDGKGGGVATDIGRDGRAHRRRLESRDSSSSYSSSASDPLVSPVRSSSAVIGHVDDDALAYDAETVGPNDDDDHRYRRGGMTEIGAGGIVFEAVEAAAS
jgi:hypothetical protein